MVSFIHPKTWKHKKNPSVHEWINKQNVDIDTMEHRSVIKRNEVLIHGIV